jgi:hypothetical protein
VRQKRIHEDSVRHAIGLAEIDHRALLFAETFVGTQPVKGVADAYLLGERVVGAQENARRRYEPLQGAQHRWVRREGRVVVQAPEQVEGVFGGGTHHPLERLG